MKVTFHLCSCIRDNIKSDFHFLILRFIPLNNRVYLGSPPTNSEKVVR